MSGSDDLEALRRQLAAQRGPLGSGHDPPRGGSSPPPRSPSGFGAAVRAALIVLALIAAGLLVKSLATKDASSSSSSSTVPPAVTGSSFDDPAPSTVDATNDVGVIQAESLIETVQMMHPEPVSCSPLDRDGVTVLARVSCSVPADGTQVVYLSFASASAMNDHYASVRANTQPSGSTNACPSDGTWHFNGTPSVERGSLMLRYQASLRTRFAIWTYAAYSVEGYLTGTSAKTACQVWGDLEFR